MAGRCAGRAGRPVQPRGVSRMLRRRGARRHAAGAATRCHPLDRDSAGPRQRCSRGCRCPGSWCAAASRPGAEPARRPDALARGAQAQGGCGGRGRGLYRGAGGGGAAACADVAAAEAAASGWCDPLGHRLREPGGYAASAPSGRSRGLGEAAIIAGAACGHHGACAGGRLQPGGGLRGPARSGRTATISRQQSRPDDAGACRQRCRQEGTSCLEFGPAESLGKSGDRKG